MVHFHDRVDAGRQLALRLEHLRGLDVVVIGLPRGGVPVAAQVARSLGTPLEVIVVRKLGLPHQPEVAMGAIGEGGVRLLDSRTIAAAGVSLEEVRAVEQRERVEMEARIARLIPNRRPRAFHGRIAVIVDDGMATGLTARVASMVARSLGASRVVVAVPVAPFDVAVHFDGADEVVAIDTPRDFLAVGLYYDDFDPISDSEVVALRQERGIEGP